MNSAEKKAPEPSMDDIISSIRNIIADDTPDSSAAAPAVVEETAPAPVVQLTENQIAEPVAAPEVPVASEPVMAPDPATAPVQAPAPVVATASEATDASVPASAEIAREIAEVPGVTSAATAPVPAPPQTPDVPAAEVAAPDPAANIATAAAPAAEIPQAVAQPAPAVEAPVAPPVTAAPEPEAPLTPVSEMAPPAPVPAPPPVADPANDIAFAETPAVTVETPEPIAPPALAPAVPDQAAPEPAPVADTSAGDLSISPLDQALDEPGDPVGEMMRAADAEPTGKDPFNNDIDPDQILDGMNPATVEVAKPVAADLTEVSEVSPVAPGEKAAHPETVADDPVVIDASHVTAEDAAAITAVAAATSEALAHTPEPAQKAAGNSLEDSIKAMLKPMIRDWLDDNMPRILEDAVKEEVDGSGSKES